MLPDRQVISVSFFPCSFHARGESAPEEATIHPFIVVIL
jgi:hypothetical protein